MVKAITSNICRERLSGELGALIGDDEFWPSVMFDPTLCQSIPNGLRLFVWQPLGHLIPNAPTNNVDKHTVEVRHVDQIYSNNLVEG